MLHARRKRRGPGRSGDVIGCGLGRGCDSPPTRPRNLPRGTAAYVRIRILNEHKDLFVSLSPSIQVEVRYH